ncbi:UPF0149 family protein [Aeromonas rivuli]|uniref:UPF0149 family protein n=1 Tax=Aeromonas rivuli TaxID=648794 RepID=UPI0005A70638|nr:UPF0149 family protein [Aeromonas rivuli]
MTPANRTRLLNSWLQQQSGDDMSYPALHGFLCARLTGPQQPDWQTPLQGLLAQGRTATLDDKSEFALAHLIEELQAQADARTLSLPSQCRLSNDRPEQVFETSHPLGQWSYGFSQGLACWPTPTNLNDPVTQRRLRLAAELSLFRDLSLARMLHQAAASELPFLDFCKRQRQQMKGALNGLLEAHQWPLSQEEPHTPASEQAKQWQSWFEQANACRSPQARLVWFERIIQDAEPRFDDPFWQGLEGHGWVAQEARPLLAAWAGRADCLFELGLLPQARREYEALLARCRLDEPGCRYPLASLYAMTAEWHALEALLTRFDEASCALLYSQALMWFARKEPDQAKKSLARALASNAHVPAYLLGQRKLPKQAPHYWQSGSRDEAASYALQGRTAWLAEGALLWLRAQAK